MRKVARVGMAAILVAAFVPVPLAGLAAERLDQVPDESRRQIQEALGAPFVVFRLPLQDHLKLSEEQKKALDEELEEQIQAAMTMFQRLEGEKPEEREKQLNEHRMKASEKLSALLKKTLTGDQLKRLRQVELQQEGTIALGQPEVGKELKLTLEQRKQFETLMKALQKEIEPLIKEAQSGGNPEEIRPRVWKLRRETEKKIEAILDDAQKKQWKEMLGTPIDLGEIG